MKDLIQAIEEMPDFIHKKVVKKCDVIDLINTHMPEEPTEAAIDAMMGAFGEVQIFGPQPPATRDTVIAIYKAMLEATNAQ